MVTKLLGCSFIGIDAYTVEIEVDIRSGSLPSVVIVGLPDAAVKESRDRIQSAMENLDYQFPKRELVVVMVSSLTTRPTRKHRARPTLIRTSS